MQQQPHPDGFSIDRLQPFLAALAGLGPAEIRKAKLLFIRNAISEYHAAKTSVEAFKSSQGALVLLPVFGSVLSAQRDILKSQLQPQREKIQNAIDVWRDDFKGEVFTIDGQAVKVE